MHSSGTVFQVGANWETDQGATGLQIEDFHPEVFKECGRLSHKLCEGVWRRGPPGWMRRPLGHLCAGGWGRSGELAAQMLPSGEALMGRMPEADSLLTQLPTEKHLVSLPEGGQVDARGVQVLQHT